MRKRGGFELGQGRGIPRRPGIRLDAEVKRFEKLGYRSHDNVCGLTSLRLTGASRDAQKYRTRESVTQRFASGATASWAAAASACECDGRIAQSRQSQDVRRS